MMSSPNKIQVGVIGGAGYAAGQLLSILQYHPEAEITFIQSDSQAGKQIQEVHPFIHEKLSNFQKDYNFEVDVLFLCKGHGRSEGIVHQIPTSVRVIDLSRDFRLHGDHDFVYGLPELNREQIRLASHIANPGCFATSIQLALLPKAATHQLTSEIHIHAITGSTGAGQKLQSTAHFTWRNSNVSLYKVLQHQHIDEIEQSLRQLQPNIPAIHFVPMRGNYTRGILSSLYFRSDQTQEETIDLYHDFYESHPFVQITSKAIDLKQVVNTNMAKIQIQKIGEIIHVTSILDNLIKGASGQAVQNMNLIFGFPEDQGLRFPGINY